MDSINLLFLWIATYIPDIKDDYGTSLKSLLAKTRIFHETWANNNTKKLKKDSITDWQVYKTRNVTAPFTTKQA